MKSDQEIREEDLPKSLADIVSAIGFPATLKLVECYGGIRLCVPQIESLAEDHPIVQTIGYEAACALSWLANGLRIDVPRGATAIRRARDRAIRRESIAQPASQQARKYHLTERQIFQIRSAKDVASMQRDQRHGKVEP